MLIQISNSFVEIDVDDLPEVSGFPWRIDANGYAVFRPAGTSSLVYMHRVIVKPEHGYSVDHRSGVRSINTRANLRVCSHAENMRNKRISKNNQSGFKGVYRRGGRWVAEIKCDGKKYRLGSHATPEDAHEKYCAAALALHKEFANFGEIRHPLAA